MLEKEKQKKEKLNGKRPTIPIKIEFFKLVIQKRENVIMDVWQALFDTICVRKGEKRAFSCALSVLPYFLGPKTARKNYKNSRFSGHLFSGKRCFGAWVKKCFLLTVFLKSCVS